MKPATKNAIRDKIEAIEVGAGAASEAELETQIGVGVWTEDDTSENVESILGADDYAAILTLLGGNSFTFDDGSGDSPSLIQKNESDEYVSQYLHDNGGWTFDGLNAGGIFMYPASGFNFNIIPTGEGDGLLITDAGGQTSVKLHVPDGTDNLYLTGDLQIPDGKQILDVSGDAVVQINDGQEWEWVGNQTGIGVVNLSDEGNLRVDGTAYSAATKTNTNTTYDGGGTGNIHKHEDGTNPTVDEAGDIKIDTTREQLLLYGGSLRVVPTHQIECITVPDIDGTTHDNVPIYSHPDGFTVTNEWCWTEGGTSVEITLSNGADNIDTMLCVPTGFQYFDTDGNDCGAYCDGTLSNNVFAAFEQMEFDTGTETGTVDFVNICFEYTVTRR